MYSYATKRKPTSPAAGQRSALSPREENSALGSYLSGLKSSPLSMSGELQQKIRERCGISPEGIRVYRDKGLADLGQKAYARGNEIHVAENAGSLDSEAGHKMILHETAHIVQQGKSHSIAAGINETPALESEAHAVADGAHMNAAGFSAPLPAQAAPIQGLGRWDKAKKWLASGGRAIAGAAKKTGGAIANGAVSAYDWVRNKMDDHAEHKKQKEEREGPGFFSRLGTKISDSYQGSWLQTAVNGAGKGLKAAGHGIATAAKATGRGLAAAGRGIAGGAKWLGSGIASGAKSLGGWFKERFKKDPNAEPGFFSKLGTKISDAYQGSMLQRGVNAAGRGLKWAGNGIKNAAKSGAAGIKKAYQGSLLQRGVNGAGRGLKAVGHGIASVAKMVGGGAVRAAKATGNWFKDRKQDVTDWWQEKKDAMAEHEKTRYMTNKANRELSEGSDYVGRIEAARLALGNGEIGERMRNRANIDDVLDYKSTRGEATMKDKAKGMLANRQKLASTGIGGALSLGGTIGKKFVADNVGGFIEGGVGAAKGAANLAMHGYQKSQVNGVSEDTLKNGATDEQARMLRLAQGNMSDKLSRDMVGDGFNIAKGAITAAGTGLNFVAPGASTVAKVVGAGASLGSNVVQGGMASRGNWRSIKDEIFGSDEDYQAFKKAHGLRSKDMKLLLAEQTGFRDVDEMADASKWQQAQTIDEMLGQDGDNGAKALMAAKGIKGDALKSKDLDSIAEDDVGTGLSLKTLEHNRDRRLKKRAKAGA